MVTVCCQWNFPDNTVQWPERSSRVLRASTGSTSSTTRSGSCTSSTTRSITIGHDVSRGGTTNCRNTSRDSHKTLRIWVSYIYIFCSRRDRPFLLS